MIRPQIVSTAVFVLATATPALAHVEQAPHTHAGETNGLLAALALAGVAGLLFLKRRLVAVRS